MKENIPYHLLIDFAEPLKEILKVMEQGNLKYAPNDWKKNDFSAEHFIKKTLRHLFQHIEGQQFDEETGLLHLAHATTDLIYAIYHLNNDNKININYEIS